MNMGWFKPESIFVVDSRPDDYQMLLDQAPDSGSIVFLSTGEQALRAAALSRGRLWIINSRLPDTTGVELHAQLKPQLGRTPTILVADAYNPDDELAALCAGSLHFLCKPLSPDWLASFVQPLQESTLQPAFSARAIAQGNSRSDLNLTTV